MDDLISRQTALNALGERPVVWSDNDDYTLGERNQYDMDRLAIETVPSAQPECEDTISRSHFDERVRLAGGMSEEELTDDFKDGVLTVLEMLRTEPSVTPKQPGWIPVTERLPESDMDVLVTDGEDCAVAYWRTDAQAWDDSMHGWCDLYGLDVIAWQPLPKPWEGRQDG